MKEIEIGEYVRTKNGYIRKIVTKRLNGYLVNLSYYNEIIQEYTVGIIELEDIKNHNENIIELVEVGDFVNGYRVDQINLKTTLWTEIDGDLFKICDAEDIKTILTKEQYEANCYRLEEI